MTRRLLALLSIVLVIAALITGLHGAQDKSGAVCGSSLSWAFGHHASSGGEVSGAARISSDLECRADARHRLANGGLLLLVGLVGLAGCTIAARRAAGAVTS